MVSAFKNNYRRGFCMNTVALSFFFFSFPKPVHSLSVHIWRVASGLQHKLAQVDQRINYIPSLEPRVVNTRTSYNKLSRFTWVAQDLCTSTKTCRNNRTTQLPTCIHILYMITQPLARRNAHIHSRLLHAAKVTAQTIKDPIPSRLLIRHLC